MQIESAFGVDPIGSPPAGPATALRGRPRRCRGRRASSFQTTDTGRPPHYLRPGDRSRHLC